MMIASRATTTSISISENPRGWAAARLQRSDAIWLRERAVVRKLWQAVPEARRGRLRFLYERWNGAGKGKDESPGLPTELQEALVIHYAADLNRLVSAGIAPPPWVDRYPVH